MLKKCYTFSYAQTLSYHDGHGHGLRRSYINYSLQPNSGDDRICQNRVFVQINYE